MSDLKNVWEPPMEVSRQQCVEASDALLAMTDIAIRQHEDIFRIDATEMAWDIGVRIYEPQDESRAAIGPDGKNIGVFMLHGGSGDWRQVEPLALMVARKFGYKVAVMTYPGRLYLLDPGRNWPGDTLYPDGTVRTPLWQKEERITADQYELKTDESMRARYGRRFNAVAKEGTPFYYRMAAWPAAFEEAMKTACRRHFPQKHYSIYVHGHSTGGPFVHYLTQRVSNIAGVIGVENTPFGYIFIEMLQHVGRQRMRGKWKDPFNYLEIRTWRHVARMMGPEAISRDGLDALKSLPMLMENVLDQWEVKKTSPMFKAEYMIHHCGIDSLTQAARVTAGRLKMNQDETEALIKRYIGYTQELTGPDVKPVPPLLLGTSKMSVNHQIKIYREVMLPMFAAMKPPPKVRAVYLDAGAHNKWLPEKDLPLGIVPAVVRLWHQAITGGYFLT